jgi:hypothetical protein
MQGMFYGTTTFNQNLSSWIVSQITNSQYFNTASALTTENLPNFDTAP